MAEWAESDVDKAQRAISFSGIPECVLPPSQPRAAPRRRKGGRPARGRLLPHLARRGRRAHRQDAPRGPLREGPLGVGGAEERDGGRYKECQDRP